MTVNVDISKCSNHFLYEVAKLTDSPDILKEITEHAINVANYDDLKPEFDEEESYLEAVVNNPNVTDEVLLAIIKYPNAPYARWELLNTVKLNINLIKQFSKFEKDFSLINILIKKHQITSEIADVIANRIINGEIILDEKKVINQDCMTKKVFKQNIEQIIIQKCTDQTKEKLKEWVSKNFII